MRNMGNIFKYIVFFACLLGIHSCISEYIPEDIEDVSDLLVITGTITNGESIFQLSRSVGLSDFFSQGNLINNASLYVETDDGTRITGNSIGDGEYSVLTGTLKPDKKYRLCLSVDGEEYQSTFLSPLFTPEIDNISTEKKAPGNPVYITVSTHDPTNQSNYYRWLYKENWEVKAEYAANAGYIDGKFTLFDLSTPVNTYYCWGKDHSRKLSLGSSEKLTENIISNKKIIEIPCDDDKLSVLYHVAVKQIQVRGEAYDYFSNLQKNVEQTGSIFASIPSEMKGNISCITNPELPVIGFIEVSTTTFKELYVPENGELFEAPMSSSCMESLNTRHMGYLAFYIYNPPEILYIEPKCVDCRMRSKVSKNKPDFWPTDHL